MKFSVCFRWICSIVCTPTHTNCKFVVVCGAIEYALDNNLISPKPSIPYKPISSCGKNPHNYRYLTSERRCATHFVNAALKNKQALLAQQVYCHDDVSQANILMKCCLLRLQERETFIASSSADLGSTRRKIALWKQDSDLTIRQLCFQRSWSLLVALENLL